MRNDCFENVNRQRDIAIFAARATLMTLLIDSALFGAMEIPVTFFMMRSRTIRACSASSS